MEALAQKMAVLPILQPPETVAVAVPQTPVQVVEATGAMVVKEAMILVI